MTVTEIPSRLVPTPHGPMLVKRIGCEVCGWKILVPAQATRAWCIKHSGNRGAEAIEAPTVILDQFRIERTSRMPERYVPPPEPEPEPEPVVRPWLDGMKLSEKIALGMEWIPEVKAEHRAAADRLAQQVRRGEVERGSRPPGKHGSLVNEVIAERLGIRALDFEVGRHVMGYVLESPDRYADLADVIDQKSPHSARTLLYKRQREWRRDHGDEPEPKFQPQEVRSKKPATEQQVGMLVAQLNGIGGAARELLVGELDEGKRREWSSMMRESIKALQQLAKQIQGKPEENQP